MTLETNRSAQVFYQAFPERTFIPQENNNIAESAVKTYFIPCIKYLKHEIHCLSQFLGKKNINPPFKRELNKTKECSAIENCSATKLKIAILSPSEFIPAHIDFTGIHLIFRSKDNELNERQASKEDSIFLNRNLNFNQKIEILRNSESIEKLCIENPSRFVKQSDRCILDNEFNIIYKLQRSSHASANSIYIRAVMAKQETKNIILPMKETWSIKQEDKISPVTIEEYIPDFVDINKLQYDYFEKPELFDEAIKDLAFLSCGSLIRTSSITGSTHLPTDIEGLAIQPEDFLAVPKTKSYNLCKLHHSSQVYGSKLDRKVTKINRTIYRIVSRKGEDNFIPSVSTRQSKCDTTGMTKCNFNKIPMKYCKKDNRYKFVLTNIEKCRQPDSSTIETLIYMFPKHKNLILSIFEEHSDTTVPSNLNANCRKSENTPRNKYLFDKETAITVNKSFRLIMDESKENDLKYKLKSSRDRNISKDIIYHLAGSHLYKFLDTGAALKYKLKKLISIASPYPTGAVILKESNYQSEDDDSDTSSISSMSSLDSLEELSSVSDDELSIFENELDESKSDNELDDELDEYESDNEFLNRAQSFVSMDSLASSIVELEEAKAKEERAKEERTKNLKSINPSCMEKFIQKEEPSVEIAEEIKEAKFYIGKPRCGIREKTKGIIDTYKNIPLIGDESSESESSDED